MKGNFWNINELDLNEYLEKRRGMLLSKQVPLVPTKEHYEKLELLNASPSDSESGTASLSSTKKSIVEYEINGVMKPTFDMWDIIFGDYGASYKQIESDFEKIANNANIKGVLLVVNSPGGVAVGFEEAREAIEKLNKPVVGYVQNEAYSMAYKFLSGVDYIVAGKSAYLGSIGSLWYSVNFHDALTKEGMKPVVLRGGEKKAKPFPLDPYKEEDYIDMEEMVKKNYEAFCGIVAKNRGLTVEQVKETQAKTFDSENALEKGLIDKIGSKQDAIKHLKNLIEQGESSDQRAMLPLTSSTFTMTTQNQNPVTTVDTAKMTAMESEMETLRAENSQLKERLNAFEKRENDRIEAERSEVLKTLEASCKSPSILALYQKASLEELKAIQSEITASPEKDDSKNSEDSTVKVEPEPVKTVNLFKGQLVNPSNASTKSKEQEDREKRLEGIYEQAARG